MKKQTSDHLDALMSRYPVLQGLRDPIVKAFNALVGCHKQGRTVLICGNGGSAADAEHIVGELMKGFMLKRPMDAASAAKIRKIAGPDADVLVKGLQCGIPAISLVSHVSLNTAVLNDNGGDLVFAQQVFGYGHAGDVLIGLSTSGNARNVGLAMKTARALEVTTIGLTGQSGGAMKGLCDILIAVPATGSYKVQELHMPVYHALCLMVEAELFEI
jgi:D-sedoheptulose 7-phosphate isomerase